MSTAKRKIRKQLRARTHVLNVEATCDSTLDYAHQLLNIVAMCESVKGVRRARFDTFPIGLVSERFELILKPCLAARKGESFDNRTIICESLFPSYEILGRKRVKW